MNKILLSLACISVLAFVCDAANAGVVEGGVKGTGKGVKSVAGGVGKVLKTIF